MTIVGHEEGPEGLQLNLPAAHSAGRMARRMVAEYAGAQGVPEEELSTLEFVVGELIDNAVDHGGGGGAREVSDLPSDVRMHVRMRVSDGQWRVQVDDQGGGDLDSLVPLLDPPDGIPDLEDERGRGFFLLSGMVDELSAAKSEDGLGLALIAEKRFAPESAG